MGFSDFHGPRSGSPPILRPGSTPINLGNVLQEQRSIMKLIIAIIQPDKLEAVQLALASAEVFRLTVMEVQGFGRQLGYTEVYRGHEYKVNLLKKLQLEIGVNDDFVEPTIEAIIKAGRTEHDGKIGDGKIFVLPLEDCVRIRTGERGGAAI
jgi:nitrogen regulatory protein P-II 2